MTQVITTASQKGGVGKTSLAQNLGMELALLKQRVLCVDFDPQSNLTTGWGIDPAIERPTIYTAMLNPEKAKDCILNLRPALDLIPANLDLAGAELQFSAAVDRNNKLRKALSNIVNLYDWVIIDAPPSLGFFTINALSAASQVYIPLQCQIYAYKAIDQIINIIQQVQEINPPLTIGAIVLTMHDSRNSLTTSVEEAARKRFGDLVTKTVIPVNVRIAEAPLDGVPVSEYDAKSTGAEAYRKLAMEVINRAQKK